MIALSVKVTSNLHSVELPVRVRTEALANAADQVADSLRDNFRRFRGRRFWREAADSVDVSPGTASAINVLVTQRGVRLQWLGLDPNKPKHASLMAIPANKAITERPRAYPNLKLIIPPVAPGSRLRGWLVLGEVAAAKHKYKTHPAGRAITGAVMRGGRPIIMFSLVTHTSHRPHPEVIPSLNQLEHTVASAIRETLNQYLNHA